MPFQDVWSLRMRCQQGPFHDNCAETHGSRAIRRASCVTRVRRSGKIRSACLGFCWHVFCSVLPGRLEMAEAMVAGKDTRHLFAAQKGARRRHAVHSNANRGGGASRKGSRSARSTRRRQFSCKSASAAEELECWRSGTRLRGRPV